MVIKGKHNILRVALSFWISATFLLSCDRSSPVEDNNENLMTQQADSLIILESSNGKQSLRFETPLMETYEFAKEPFREFRQGIYIETYDSTGTIESTLIADYAIEYTNKKLWEAKGDVVATNAKGEILETQQLFWNQLTKKVYSNVDSRVTQGTDVIIGTGFESDEEFKEWEIRNPRGKVTVELEPNRGDTTSTDSTENPDIGDMAPVDENHDDTLE